MCMRAYMVRVSMRAYTYVCGELSSHDPTFLCELFVACYAGDHYPLSQEQLS